MKMNSQKDLPLGWTTNKNIEVLLFLESPSKGEKHCQLMYTFLRMPHKPHINALIYIGAGFKTAYTFHTFYCKLMSNDIKSSL